MISRYEQILKLWEATADQPIAVQTVERDVVRMLDAQMSDEIQPFIAQWQEGLIGTIELFQQFYLIAFGEAI